jgi:hypothetical protein
MDDSQIMANIKNLVDEEHELRERLTRGEVTAADERSRLRTLEESLDQCWDLLRQRRALKDAGENPDEAETRPASQVEGYLQ